MISLLSKQIKEEYISHPYISMQGGSELKLAKNYFYRLCSPDSREKKNC
jgi:hypothetical protein